MVIALCSANTHAQIDRSRFIQMSASIVKVEAVDDQGKFGLGTGVTVGPGLVATNCHVTRRAQELRVVKGGVRFGVTSQLVDEKHDLCLLYAPNWRSKPVELGSSQSLMRGQAVAGLGYVGGLELSMRDGEVIALHRYDQAKVIQTDAAFTSGASGGGLFDEQGRLIGLMTFRLRGGNNHYFVVPVDWLRGLLKRHKQTEVVSETADSLAFWEQKMDAQPYFLRAVSLKQNEEWKSLQSLTDSWVLSEPENPDAWTTSAEALLRNDDVRRAQSQASKALDLDQGFAQAWYFLGVASQRNGDLVRAREALTKLMPLDASLAKILKDLINAVR